MDTNYITKEKNDIDEFFKISLEIPKPKELYSYLNQYIIGQDEAKKTLSVAVSNHYKRILSNVYGASTSKEFDYVVIEKSNVILLGNTGTGKTYLVKTLAKRLGIPCYIADATKLTESGYVGDDVENILVGLLQEADYNIELAQQGIVMIDEIDKIARKSDNPSITRDVSGEGVQQGLLKIVEGSVIGVPPKGGRKHPNQDLIYIDTSNILFIGMGAFDGIQNVIEKRMNTKSIGFNKPNTVDNENNDILDNIIPTDLKYFGLIPELIGRFPIITHTKDLDIDDLCRIIKEPKNSILKQYQKLLMLDGINLSFNDEAVKEIATIVLDLKIGARGLRSIMETLLSDIMYDFSDSDKDVVITKDFVQNSLKKYYNKKVA